MGKQFGDYYLGLDIGTGSVGWAVTDTSYNVLKFNGKAMWGARLFDTANTAAGTRAARTGRRRLERQRQRIKYLQEFFSEVISQVDPGFFMRMQESNLRHDERINTKQSSGKYYSIFNDGKYTDKEYYAAYPTIYHLRKALIDGEQLDVRLVYLAIKHILNHRGHFLLDGDLDAVDNFNVALEELNGYLSENFERYLFVSEGNLIELQNILKDKKISRTLKKDKILELLKVDKKDKQLTAIVKSICGLKFNVAEVLADASLKDEDTGKEIQIELSQLEDGKYDELETLLGDNIVLIDKLKAIYNWSLLSEILSGEKYISYAKVKIYDEHQRDLVTLKNLLKRKNLQDKKKVIFSYTKGSKDANYSAYIGMCNKNGQKVDIDSSCTYDDFCAFLKKQLADITDLSQEEEELIARIDAGIAFPKQIVKDNGVIPMQLHKAELCAILNNAVAYLSFLSEKDEGGLTVADKILKVFEFRVPYYVGPLNGTEDSIKKGRCWVKRSEGKVNPWNFTDIVDVEESAERFISKMTNKCTYLVGEDVLPKNSLLYTEFVVRNELNNIRVDGQRLDSKYINLIYDQLLLHGNVKGKVTRNKIKAFLANNNIRGEISGIDIALNASLKVFRDFYAIFGEAYVNIHRDVIENLIKWITLFGDEPGMLFTKIKKEYPKMDAALINKVKKLKYKDWGRLSKTLLESEKISYLDASTGEIVTVISAMRNTNMNFMELIEGENIYNFKNRIKDFNAGTSTADNVFDYAYLDNLYVSPAVKREIWQTILIVKELKKILGHGPKKIFIEMARGEEEKKRTVSRKQQLLELYKSCKKEEPELLAALNECTEEDLRRNVLYLYYTQLGKDMYTGKAINMAELSTSYDKDHIYPRSKTKDDSIINNLVLVNRTDNARKTDVYPLPDVVREKMYPFWKQLKEKGFISEEKFRRLTRTTPLSDDELAAFINRQLVETRQSTKVAADILGKAFPDTKIVYSKAVHVSDFRDLFKLVKCREVNDLHHAKDAYLNIVVGNVYDTKFTSNPLKFIKSGQQYSLNPEVMFKYWDVKGAWVADRQGESGTIATVRKYMARNNVLVTWMQHEGHGKIFDVKPVKKSDKKKGERMIPVKKNLPVEFYGGYNSVSTAYFALVESESKGKKIRTLEMIPIYRKKLYEALEDKGVFFEQVPYKLNHPEVLAERILLKSKININGMSMIITGISKKQIIAHLADELVVDEETLKYIDKIEKFLQRKRKNKMAVLTGFDSITSDKNIELYKYLLEKHKSGVYKNRPSGQILTLEKGMTAFEGLSLEEQVITLNEVLKLFACKPGKVDLRNIGASAGVGRVRLNKDITNNNDIVSLINSSVTGLFQQEIDLLKI